MELFKIQTFQDVATHQGEDFITLFRFNIVGVIFRRLLIKLLFSSLVHISSYFTKLKS
jgi:hypothetical protein